MPPIEVGATSAVGAVLRLARSGGGGRADRVGTAQDAAVAPAVPAGTAAATLNGVQTSSTLEAGSAPVDQDRVAEIRKAVQSGTYPIVPAKIADAMIAAGMLLRSPQ